MKLRYITYSTTEQQEKIAKLLKKMDIDYVDYLVIYGEGEYMFRASKKDWKKIKRKLVVDKLELNVMY